MNYDINFVLGVVFIVIITTIGICYATDNPNAKDDSVGLRILFVLTTFLLVAIPFFLGLSSEVSP